MKKLVSILLTVAVLMATFIPVAAMAERHHFYINNVECWSESAPTKYYPTEIWKYNSIERCYVDHSAAGTSNAYTNLFHAQRGSSVGIIGIASGQKCAPLIHMSRFRATPSTRTSTMASAAAATRSTISMRVFGVQRHWRLRSQPHPVTMNKHRWRSAPLGLIAIGNVQLAILG